MDRKNRPNWWLVYLTVPLMIGLLLIDGRVTASPAVHEVLEFGIVLVTFGLMALWVKANQGALLDDETASGGWILACQTDGAGSPASDGDPTTLRDRCAGTAASHVRFESAIDPNTLLRVDLPDDANIPVVRLEADTKGRFN